LTTSTVKAPVPDQPEWRISVTVDGGFAGLVQQFSADSSSTSLVAEDKKNRKQTIVALSVVEQRELGRLMAFSSVSSSIDRRSSACTDCYHFQLTVERAGMHRDAHYDSTTLVGSPDDQLISRIISIGRTGLIRK
jgi:hypothetical protein